MSFQKMKLLKVLVREVIEWALAIGFLYGGAIALTYLVMGVV